MADLNIEEGSRVLAAKLATEVGRYGVMLFKISKRASYEKRFYNKYNYPIITTLIYKLGKNMPSPKNYFGNHSRPRK